MADLPPTADYRWLQIAGTLTLVLAAFVALVGVRHQTDPRRESREVKARAAEMMNRIEAEAERMRKAASKP